MRQSIWKKAKKIKDQLVYAGKGNWFEFWRFNYETEGLKDYISLRVECDGNGTKIDCTCKHCTTNLGKYLCQYKSALIWKKIEMVKDEKKP